MFSTFYEIYHFRYKNHLKFVVAIESISNRYSLFCTEISDSLYTTNISMRVAKDNEAKEKREKKKNKQSFMQ